MVSLVKVLENKITYVYRFQALTLHNVVFQAQVMGRAREAIIQGQFPEYLRFFFARYFGDAGYPQWCVNALRSVGVDLLEGNSKAKIIPGSGAKWEYSDNPPQK